LGQEYFSNKKQILMGYYADLEVERSIAEGDYGNTTYSKKGAIRGITNYLYKKGFKKEEDRTTIVNSFIEQSLGSSVKKSMKQCALIQDNFSKFTSFVESNFIKNTKAPS
jgi:hypothetical protein